MATRADVVRFILEKLGSSGRFEAKPMFGEYGLYADGRFVAVICDDQLYVKIVPQSAPLAARCDQDAPYPGAKPHYLVEESLVSRLTELPSILLAMAAALPAKRPKSAKAKKARG
ncbi:MAG: TfoX/Sxy family protein [Verrucomicrobiales bacterium]|nr:TfoX/Sxy family protein [Verrucomicrobiales bacterium]